MTAIQKATVFLNYFGTGLFAPILSLFILSHGCDLQSLAVVIGIYSTTVVLAEVPSGIFADLRGRKKAFYLSCVFSTASFVLMYFSNGVFMLAVGIILFGLGRAFISGSLDSLIMEDCLKKGGEEGLSAAAGANLVCQSAGIAAGALLGGFLPETGGYLLHIVIRLAVLGAVAALCAVFIKESPRTAKQRRSLGGHLRTMAAELKSKLFLRVIMLCIFGYGMTMFAMETYWQPQFSALLVPKQQYLLGVICAAGYFGCTLGSLVAGKFRMTGAKSRWLCYLAFISLFGLSLCFLSAQKSVFGFMALYILAQAALGVLCVPEQTLLNSLAADETRASLLSVASLFSQCAGVLCSAVCAALVLPVGTSGVMLIMGGVTVFAAVVAAAVVLPKALKTEKISS